MTKSNAVLSVELRFGGSRRTAEIDLAPLVRAVAEVVRGIVADELAAAPKQLRGDPDVRARNFTEEVGRAFMEYYGKPPCGSGGK